MFRSLRFLAALIVAASAVPALATNGMRMTGFGAVQNGMGGVGTALTLDSSTIVTNPAGLSDLDRRLDVSVTWFDPTVDYIGLTGVRLRHHARPRPAAGRSSPPSAWCCRSAAT